MKKKTTPLALVLVVLATLVGMTTSAAAATVNDTENTSVSVTVSAETALDVKPDSLTYSSASVGNLVNNSDNSFTGLMVENTGSEDIMEVWLETTMPNTNPFGTGTSTNHDAGNFLKVKPRNATPTEIRGDESDYHYVTRVEFFEDDLSVVQTGSSWYSTSFANFDTGRFRFGDHEFNFVLANDGSCDGSSGNSAILRVANTPSTPTSLGTYDFSDSNSANYEEVNITTASQTSYGVGNSSVTFSYNSNTEKYDVLTACEEGATDGGGGFTENHVLLNKYDIQAGGSNDLQATDGSTTTQILRSTASNDDLFPGASFTVDTAIQVPRGVPQGSMTAGTLSVKAATSTN